MEDGVFPLALAVLLQARGFSDFLSLHTPGGVAVEVEETGPKSQWCTLNQCVPKAIAKLPELERDGGNSSENPTCVHVRRAEDSSFKLCAVPSILANTKFLVCVDFKTPKL